MPYLEPDPLSNIKSKSDISGGCGPACLSKGHGFFFFYQIPCSVMIVTMSRGLRLVVGHLCPMAWVFVCWSIHPCVHVLAWFWPALQVSLSSDGWGLDSTPALLMRGGFLFGEADLTSSRKSSWFLDSGQTRSDLKGSC